MSNPIGHRPVSPDPNHPGHVLIHNVAPVTPGKELGVHSSKDLLKKFPDQTSSLDLKDKDIQPTTPEKSHARESIVSILLGPDQKLDFGKKLTDLELDTARDKLLGSPHLRENLETAIKARKDEINNGGILKIISHFFASCIGTSITGQAEKLLKEVNSSIEEKKAKAEKSKEKQKATADANAKSDIERPFFDHTKVPPVPIRVENKMIANGVDGKTVVYKGLISRRSNQGKDRDLPHDNAGEAHLEDGTQLNGKFEYGKFVEGTKLTPDGTKMTGHFVGGKIKNNSEVVVETTDLRVKGNFVNGKLAGEGTQTDKTTGKVTPVRFENGKAVPINQASTNPTPPSQNPNQEPFRTIQFTDLDGILVNAQYQGKLKDGLPDGEGVLIYEGWTRSGKFVNGELDGQGEKFDGDGNYSKGTFSKGRLNGDGIMKIGNTVYEGRFENGQYMG